MVRSSRLGRKTGGSIPLTLSGLLDAVAWLLRNVRGGAAPGEGVTGLPPEKEGTEGAAGCLPVAGELALVGAEMERLRAVLREHGI